MSSKPKIKTRFAPSPTGLLHVGGLRTALYNYLLAKHHNGDFILRIEDTDPARKIAGAEDNIKTTLRQFGLTWDNKKIIFQSERLASYKKQAEQLVAGGTAYYCDCSAQRLEKIRNEQTKNKQAPRYDGHCRDRNLKPTDHQPSVIRFKIPKTGTTAFTDSIRGEVSFENSLLDDQVILKSDGFPTYHLANVVDDHESKISAVIRGEEWLPSTPKHILLYQAFGWEAPAFAHLPLLLNPDKSKLSKRQGDVAVSEYLNKGYLPAALLNFVLLLGWNPGTEQELFTLDEMVTAFALEKVNKAGAVFDNKKLDWLNGTYLRQLSPKAFAQRCQPYFIEAGIKINQQKLTPIVATEQQRIKRLDEIVEATRFFFAAPQYKTALLPWKKMTGREALNNLKALIEKLEDLPEKDWQQSNLEQAAMALIKKEQVGVGEMLWPMRVALSGRAASPGPFEIAAALGKKETIKRLETAMIKLEKE